MTLDDIREEVAAWEKALTYAFDYLDKNEWPQTENFRKYAITFQGKLYPNKQVLKYATAYLAKHYPTYAVIPSLSGGKPINDFLETKGAKVYNGVEDIDFFKEIIANYKVHISQNGLNEEIYKWELVEKYNGRPDVTVKDFTAEIKSINFSNLVYGVGIGVIRHLAQDKPEEYRKCFELLFNESIDLSSRLLSFNTKVTELYRVLEPDITRSAHHDERTIATILTYRYPQKYTFYKDSFYRSLCKKLGEKPKQKGEKYAHYLSIVDGFVTDYIKVDEELISMVNSQKSNTSYDDSEFMILAQDILYNALEKQNDTFSLILKQLGAEVIDIYFKVLRKLIADLSLEETSEKIYFNYEKDTLIFGIGQRYVLNVEKGKYFRMISKKQGAGGTEKFQTEPKAYFNNYSLSHNIEKEYSDLLLAAKEILTVTNKSGYYKFDKKDFRALVFRELTPSTQIKERTSTMSLNQILYGPPGTGKTYHTINKALAIIENKEETILAKESREELKRRYQEYVTSGQIVFTTFHQSMGYEDFVEGIKPEIEEDKDGVRTVVYETKAGIFKELCKHAAISTVKEEQPVVYQFDEAWEDLMEDVRINTEDAKEDFVLDILTPNRGLKVTEITDQGNLRITPMSVEGLTYTVSYTRAKKLQAAFPDLSVVKNIDKEFRAVIGGSNSTAYWAVINNLNKKIAANQSIVEISSSELKPHVLIIDEINRGNVSAIFGELITLIEESKRAGASEALELTLPYSKEKFSVPSNLYIIGTMNTADRSVEALDTALRRRFAFEEMMPEPMKITTEGALIDGIIEGVDLAKVLTKINERIELLLDSDHQIGHSYLINVADLSGLANAFNNCIIPLLKEYFYHDDEKIALVLGAGFVTVKKQLENVNSLFPQMDGLDIHNIHGKSKFELKQIHSANIIEALTTLLAGE